MIISGGAIPNITSIATRNHYDLQSLNVSDDHLAYPPGAWHHNAAGLAFGLDASKPGTIAVDNIYIATDTKKMYYSYTANTWTEVTGVFAEKTAVQGDIVFRGAQGWKKLTAGTSGQFLKTLGASADPAWASAAPYSASDATSATNTTFTDGALFPLATFAIPASVWSASSGIRLKLEVGTEATNSSNTNPGPTSEIAISYNGTVMFTVAGTGTSNFTSSGAHAVYDIIIKGNGNLSSQKIIYEGWLATSSSASIPTTGYAYQTVQTTTASADISVGANLVINGRLTNHNSSSGSVIQTYYSAFIQAFS